MTSSARKARLGLAAVFTVFSLSMGALGFRSIERWIDSGKTAPQFALPDVDGQNVSLESLRGKAVVLVFWSARGARSNEYSRRIVRLAETYASDDRVVMLGIDPTITRITQPVLGELRVFSSVIGQRFPMLIDAGGAVARQYGVQTRPTVVVIDKLGRIRYRGAFDDNPDEALVRQQYCADALASTLGQQL